MPTQNPRHNNELNGTNDILAEGNIEYKDVDDVDFAGRAGLTVEEFEAAFGNRADE